MSLQRDSSIDILRAIAFIGLVAAHVKPSDFIFQLRNFDVPMMVFLSGVVYSMSDKGSESYITYISKRFVRIIIPTWIFLGLYYLVIMHDSLMDTIGKFDLMTDWYVWIMRVFFIIALFAPFIGSVMKKLNLSLYISLLFILFLLNEFLCHQPAFQGKSSDTSVIIMMNLAYLLVFSFGCIIHRMSNRLIQYVTLSSVLVFLVFGVCLWRINGMFISTQLYKYPPSIYYLSYAFIWVGTLWLLRMKIYQLTLSFHMDFLLRFIGSHTMWIYFWHIIVLHYIEECNSPFIKYLTVLFLGTAITYLQHRLVFFVTKRMSPLATKNVRMIFDG